MIDDIIFLFEAKKGRKAASRIIKLITTRQMPLNEIYDIIGELSLKDADLFLEKFYPTFIGVMATKVPHQQMVEMDEYILKKFCFLEGEQFLASFNGGISEKKVNTTGRVYLTNYRIFVSGTQIVRSAQKTHMAGTHRSGLTSTLIRSRITHSRKNIRKAINRAFRKEITSLNLGEWGYFFPTVRAYSISRKKKSIIYNVTIQTEEKPMKMNITVTPRRVKPQPKDEFFAHKEEILTQIEESLHENAF